MSSNSKSYSHPSGRITERGQAPQWSGTVLLFTPDEVAEFLAEEAARYDRIADLWAECRWAGPIADNLRRTAAGIRERIPSIRKLPPGDVDAANERHSLLIGVLRTSGAGGAPGVREAAVAVHQYLVPRAVATWRWPERVDREIVARLAAGGQDVRSLPID